MTQEQRNYLDRRNNLLEIIGRESGFLKTVKAENHPTARLFTEELPTLRRRLAKMDERIRRMDMSGAFIDSLLHDPDKLLELEKSEGGRL